MEGKICCMSNFERPEECIESNIQLEYKLGGCGPPWSKQIIILIILAKTKHLDY